jgi:hypothetical protein
MNKKDYSLITVTASPTDDLQAGLSVDAEFVKEFGGGFIDGEYFSPAQLLQQLERIPEK